MRVKPVALDSAEYEVERKYTVKANKDILERLDKFLAYISWCSGVGHSCVAGFSIDGDGADRLVVEGIKSSVDDKNVVTRPGDYEQLT